MSKGKGWTCFGCGCGFFIAIIIAIIVIVVSGIFWIKNNVYFQQPEKINKIAEDICQFTLPEELQPMFACDFPFAEFALYIYGKENKVAMATFIEAPIMQVEDRKTIALMQGVAFGVSDNLGIDNPEDVTVSTETLNSIVMVGTNKMNLTETKIRYEEDDITMMVRQGRFNKGDKMVIVTFLATEGPDTKKRATQFLNSVKP